MSGREWSRAHVNGHRDRKTPPKNNKNTKKHQKNTKIFFRADARKTSPNAQKKVDSHAPAGAIKQEKNPALKQALQKQRNEYLPRPWMFRGALLAALGFCMGRCHGEVQDVVSWSEFS